MANPAPLLELEPNITAGVELGPAQGDIPPLAAPAAAAATVALCRAGEDEDRCCRICLDGEDSKENPLISPCKCAGSMRYVHRACLDEWRVSCFNPKALVGCTTCHVPFRTRYEGPDAQRASGPWWVRFARDVAWFAGVRLLIFFVTVITLGFWPQLLLGAGAGLLHPNPLVSHFLCGTGTTLALLGTFVILQLPGLWHTGEGLRLVFDVWCPRRGGKNSGFEALVLLLIIIGLTCCLFYVLKGIYHIFNEGRHEVVRAVRGANQQVRRQVVKDFVVLNFSAEEEEAGRGSTAAGSCHGVLAMLDAPGMASHRTAEAAEQRPPEGAHAST